MRFHTFLLKYGEIGIKGKNRYLFEDALVRQVRYALKDVDGNFDVHKSQARIYVDCEGDYDYEDTVEHLKRVFGLVGICPVVRMEDKGFEELKKDVVAYMAEMYPDRNFTFKVESRRARKSYPKNSMEISRDLGEAILYAFPEIKVDVHHPDVLLVGLGVASLSMTARALPDVDAVLKSVDLADCQRLAGLATSARTADDARGAVRAELPILEELGL